LSDIDIDPAYPGHRGFLYNIWIATHLLRVGGSTADVVLMLQFGRNAATKELLPEELRITQELGIKFHPIPTPLVESFHQAMMEKFRILELLQYERVIFLDADVTPICSLDYLFEQSYPNEMNGNKSIIMENFIQAGILASPANGGLFMLQPENGDWELQHTLLMNETVLMEQTSTQQEDLDMSFSETMHGILMRHET
jgi:hypothetical protein